MYGNHGRGASKKTALITLLSYWEIHALLLHGLRGLAWYIISFILFYLILCHKLLIVMAKYLTSHVNTHVSPGSKKSAYIPPTPRWFSCTLGLTFRLVSVYDSEPFLLLNNSSLRRFQGFVPPCRLHKHECRIDLARENSSCISKIQPWNTIVPMFALTYMQERICRRLFPDIMEISRGIINENP